MEYEVTPGGDTLTISLNCFVPLTPCYQICLVSVQEILKCKTTSSGTQSKKQGIKE